MYKIYITKEEDNPNYEFEHKEWAERNKWGNNSFEKEYPKPYTTKKFLDTVLTDEEFAQIKKAVLEIM